MPWVQAVTATGATLIVVEHRVGVWAQHMDRVIVLGADGGITHDGAPETVLARVGDDVAFGPENLAVATRRNLGAR